MTTETCVRCESSVDSGGVQFKKRTYCDACIEVFEDIAEDGIVVRSRHGKQDFEKKPYIISGGGKQYIEHSQTEALARGKNLTEELNSRGLFIYCRHGSHWVLEKYLEEHPHIESDVEHARRKIRGKEPIEGDTSTESADSQVNVRAEGDAILNSTVVDDSVVNRSSVDGGNDH